MKHAALKAGYPSVKDYLAAKGEVPKETGARSSKASKRVKKRKVTVDQEEASEDDNEDDVSEPEPAEPENTDGNEENEEDEAIFEVEAVLGKRFNVKKRRTEYLVKCELSRALESDGSN
jgi:hypothetical protein